MPEPWRGNVAASVVLIDDLEDQIVAEASLGDVTNGSYGAPRHALARTDLIRFGPADPR